MSLWLALVLPAWPLQLAARALPQPAPLVIVDGPAQRLHVVHANEAAQAAGIGAGLKLAAAQALATGLIAVPRTPAVEHDALRELAGWALQFSPYVHLQEAQAAAAPNSSAPPPPAELLADSGLLFETGASETYFGGRAALHRRLTQSLRALGYRAHAGYAVTPAAAWIVARARARGLATRDAFSADTLHAALAPLPLALLGWEAAAIDALHALGLRTVADVLALPRDGLGQRFGAAALLDLQRLLGERPDPRAPFVAPEHFSARLELPADLADSAHLQRPAARLLHALEGFLRGRGAGATELRFSAHHSPRRAQPVPPTAFTLQLAAPERSALRLERLLAERLARVRLPQPAVLLALEVTHLQPLAGDTPSWLPPAPRAADRHGPAPWLALAETLHARLGSARVFQVQPVDDHRPEHAQRCVPLAIDAQAARGPAVPPPDAPRPLLLLTEPLPLPAAAETPQYHGALSLLAGPERIEAGWWDRSGDRSRGVRAVLRDYFVARNPRGQTLWVYRELTAPRGWYLHGFFA
jgi:protein ImuB